MARLPRKAQIFQRACGESGGGCAAHATLRGKNRLRERGACAGRLKGIAGKGSPGPMGLAGGKGFSRLLARVSSCSVCWDDGGLLAKAFATLRTLVGKERVMKVHVELDGGLLADRFGKYAPEPDRLEGFPVRSFPIEINDVPQEARTLALAFIDYDAIPVGGFCWIHWTACNLPATTTLSPRTPAARGRLIWCRAATAIGRPWRMAATTRKCTPVIAARSRLMPRTATR